jgi:DNA-binding transcriptional MerR regulator
MKENLITAGEFAKLAVTTKRTIQYYDRMNILKPFKINSKGYRYYKQEQILDFQVILLLQTLGISLKEIRKVLKKGVSLKELFDQKKKSVKEEIRHLQSTLKTLDNYFENLDDNGTLVSPRIKNVKTFYIYYYKLEGSYSKIAQYCTDLRNMLENIPKTSATLAIFQDEGYKPKKTKLIIGIIKKKGMKVRDESKHLVKIQKVNSFKALTWEHRGSGSTLSLFWQEMHKYMKENSIKRDYSRNEMEIYWKVSEKAYKQIFEVFIPIK